MQSTTGPQDVQLTESGSELPGSLTCYGTMMQAELGSVLPNGSMELSGPFRYHLGWADRQGRFLEAPQDQGKGVRPGLCLFACQALGGDWMRAMPAAVSLELIHNFSLVHDDIQDGDAMRRHRPTVWRLWGEAKALLVGNAMHATAYEVALGLVERGVPESKALRSSHLLVEGCLSMIKGQALDLQFEARLNIGLEAYLEMIRLKTGALITCALEVGSLLGSDDEEHVQAFARYGDHLGRMFQIRDDVLGIWGDEDHTGKAGRSSENDIKRKKKSLPIVLALEQATGGDRRRLEAVYRKAKLDQGDVDQVLEILDAVGAQKLANGMIKREGSLAMKALENVPLSRWSRGEAKSRVDFLASREH